MAEYIFTPEDREYPSREDLHSILRARDHDTITDEGTVMLSLDAWRRDLPEDLDEVNEVWESFNHLSSILGAMRSLNRPHYSNVHRNQQSLQPTLEKLVSHVDRHYRIIHFEDKTKEDITLKADCKVLYLQLLRFLQNGAESHFNNFGDSSPGGEVIINAETIQLSKKELSYLGRNNHYTLDDLFVKISVTDEGRGMPEEIIDEIFKMGVSTKKNGSGIGLALNNYLCEFMHGFIHVESEVGVGSTFSLYIPQEYKKRPERTSKIPKEIEQRIEQVPIIGRLYKRLTRNHSF